MKRTAHAAATGLLLLTATMVTRGSTATVAPEPPQAQQVLARIKAADAGQLSVSEEDGRFLRMLVASTGAKRVLEIGAASGYSAIWIGLGLIDTGGELVAIEYEPARAREAAANVTAAGLPGIVTVVGGDAFKEIPKIAGEFDLIFLDAWKPDYQKFFDLAFPRLRPGGLFLAHNVVNKQKEMPDFLRTIHHDPRVLTSVVSPGHEGISLSYKKP